MTMETQEQNKPKKRRRSKGSGFAEDAVEVTETPIAEPPAEPTQPDPEPSPEPSPEPVAQAIPPRRKAKLVARPMRRRQ
jgi:hypothetical protein